MTVLSGIFASPFTTPGYRALKSLSLRDRRWTTPSRLKAIARYPSSFSSYSHCSLSGSESVRSNSIGWIKRAEELLVPAVLAELALPLRSIRLMKKQSTDDTAQLALQRDPEQWKTGDEPMTDAQRSYLETLCRETGEEFDDTLSEGKRVEAD
jgi:Protein of unknown function (DUF3072)